MAEETKTTTIETPEAPCATEEVVISEVPVAEETKKVEAPPQPEAETVAAEVVAVVAEAEKKDESEEAKGVAESASFKEESNKVDDLIDPEKKALDELKKLVEEALKKHEFTTPPKPEEEKKAEEPKPEEEKKEEETKPVEEEKKEEEEPPKTEACEEKKEEEEVTPKIEACEGKKEEEAPTAEACEEKQEEEPVKEEEKKVEEASSTVVEKAEAALEEIKETIIHEVTSTQSPPPPCEEEPSTEAEKAAEAIEETTTPLPPEEVSLWGIPLLADERSDVILLKFLRARDFKVKEAFAMLKSVVAWRKEFKIDELLEEDLAVEGLERVVYMHGVDKEGHPVCYNAFGEFQDKELYGKTFADAEKRAKFLRWYIQLLEKNVRQLDFSPDGICTIVQITDLKNTPGLILFKKDLRQATNQAFQLLQDNYPEFVAKQVFINVPWWYVAYNRMISPFLTQRTKSKFVFAGPTKTTETLFKYIAAEQVPVPYGGLSKEGEQEFTTSEPAIEEIIKPTCKHTVEFPITEPGTLVWEVRVLGWDVCYGAEFVPSAEGGYTWIIQKSRKIGPADEQVISCSFKIGETGKVVLTFDNQTSKKKKLVYRFKTKSSSE